MERWTLGTTTTPEYLRSLIPATALCAEAGTQKPLMGAGSVCGHILVQSGCEMGPLQHYYAGVHVITNGAETEPPLWLLTLFRDLTQRGAAASLGRFIRSVRGQDEYEGWRDPEELP